MTQQIINVGTSVNSKTGDPLRTAFTKINANFADLYASVGADVQIPSQLGSGGKFLTTNGTSLSWNNPSQLINGSYNVTLGADGTLNLSQVPSVGAAVIQPNNTTFGLKLISNGNTWAFGTNGSLTFPDGSVQTTAGVSKPFSVAMAVSMS